MRVSSVTRVQQLQPARSVQPLFLHEQHMQRHRRMGTCLEHIITACNKCLQNKMEYLKEENSLHQAKSIALDQQTMELEASKDVPDTA
jgi:hypothetical protein